MEQELRDLVETWLAKAVTQQPGSPQQAYRQCAIVLNDVLQRHTCADCGTGDVFVTAHDGDGPRRMCAACAAEHYDPKGEETHAA